MAASDSLGRCQICEHRKLIQLRERSNWGIRQSFPSVGKLVVQRSQANNLFPHQKW